MMNTPRKYEGVDRNYVMVQCRSVNTQFHLLHQRAIFLTHQHHWQEKRQLILIP